ncbi:uncharacterized protein LOC124682846 isoform X2 [Lolium rigidum]|uniref:uncharacterized protein LOC124682845 isoform X2 n=1 Tax=Lolium rigidum TaxID=89674 RepID=UPI001F5DF66A|nr:uncharacterized protein LOC124682845 isoform X2 [Lolium rigidum]XP_047073417.1 uncharacterized protein LOC124682846 isoform X2 [Lolium rigidum]
MSAAAPFHPCCVHQAFSSAATVVVTSPRLHRAYLCIQGCSSIPNHVPAASWCSSPLYPSAAAKISINTASTYSVPPVNFCSVGCSIRRADVFFVSSCSSASCASLVCVLDDVKNSQIPSWFVPCPASCNSCIPIS